MSSLRLLPWLGLALWALAWSWFSREAMLDDALIYLRYADNLRELGQLSYDGVTTNWGATSLLFVAIVSGVGWIGESPLVPKVLSMLAHLGLLAWLAVRARRASELGRSTLVTMIALFVTPMAFRWLPDGMDTAGSAGLAAAVAFSLFDRAQRSAPVAVASWLAGAALGFVAVALRVELGIAIAAATVAGWLWALDRESSVDGLQPDRAGALQRAFGLLLPLAGPAAGGLLALLLAYLLTGQLLPDPGAAKSGVGGAGMAVARVIASSMLFGAGLVALWLASALGALAFERTRPRRVLSLLTANAVFPAIVAATLLRGQELQGFRHLVWPLVAGIAWNAAVLTGVRAGLAPAARRAVITAACAVFALGCAIEATWVAPLLASRSETFRQFRRADFSAIEGERSLAGDIGFFGYFTRTRLCDIRGLVHGPEVARMGRRERFLRCVDEDPAVAFVYPGDQRVQRLLFRRSGDSARSADFGGWRDCGHFVFQNLSSSGQLNVMLSPRRPDLACPKGLPE